MREVLIAVVASAFSGFLAGGLGVWVSLNLLTWRTAQLEKNVEDLWPHVNETRERVAALEGRPLH